MPILYIILVRWRADGPLGLDLKYILAVPARGHIYADKRCLHGRPLLMHGLPAITVRVEIIIYMRLLLRTPVGLAFELFGKRVDHWLGLCEGQALGGVGVHACVCQCLHDEPWAMSVNGELSTER